jgi:hypothetical protein
MPAALPGSTLAQNLANPSAGMSVSFNPFSGPKGSPFDYDVQNAPANWPLTYAQLTTKPSQASGNASTGAMSTGIGYDSDVKLPGVDTATLGPSLAAARLGTSGFDDDDQPGISMPASTPTTPVNATDARLLAIGGGRSTANTVASPSAPNPYAVQPILQAGNGGSRDAGAGPAFTGFGMKMVTATANVANGAAIEAGWVNRSGVTLATGQSQFGSSTAASPAVT